MIFMNGPTNINLSSLSSVVAQIDLFPKSTHWPKLGKYRWYFLKALLEWADDLGRWVDLGHGKVWTTTNLYKMKNLISSTNLIINKKITRSLILIILSKYLFIYFLNCFSCL